MLKLFRKLFKDRKGAALVEYGLLIAGVALVAAVAVTVFGKKTTDMIGATATVLPGAHEFDNAPIRSGRLIEITQDASGTLEVDAAAVSGRSNTSRLSDNLGMTDVEDGFATLLIQSSADDVGDAGGSTD